MNAWYAFLASHRMLETILGRELEAACEMPLTWFDVLGQLGRAPGERLTMTQLASGILFSKSGLTRLVDRLVEELGLTLDVYSEFGRGSAFHLLVPAKVLRLKTHETAAS